MMKKFFSLSLVLGLGLVAFTGAEGAFFSSGKAKTEQPASATPSVDQKQPESAPVAENAKSDAKPTDVKNQPNTEVQTSKTGFFGKAREKTCTICKSMTTYTSDRCKAFAALPVSYKVLTGLGLTAATCLVLYNTNEAFRNFIAGSDDEAAN